MSLTTAELNRLMKLNEEAAEITQQISKVVVYGKTSEWKGAPIDHLAKLENEIGDFLANLDVAIAAGDLSSANIHMHRAVKIDQLLKDPGLIESHGTDEVKKNLGWKI